jgi:hypothetical protein
VTARHLIPIRLVRHVAGLGGAEIIFIGQQKDPVNWA